MNTNYSTFQEVSNSNPSLQSAKALLIVKPENSLIQLSWKSTPTFEELTECALVISELIKENNITYFLHDVRNINYTDINLQRSLSKVFCPAILEAGITRFVHLANYALPEMLILDEITTYLRFKVITNKAVRMEICTTPEGALEWIDNSGAQTVTVAPKTEVKEISAEQVSYEWAAAAQISSSLKQYKEKAAMVFRILSKRKSLLSEI